MNIYETEQELVLKADLPEVNQHEIDIRIENNTLTIRGERKFHNEVQPGQLPAHRARKRTV